MTRQVVSKPSDDAESLYRAYEEYAKTLRTWFVGFGVGGPVLLLTNDAVRGKFGSSPYALLIGTAFLGAVASQVMLAFVNKTVNWANYHAELRGNLSQRPLYRLTSWIADQFWVDILVDLGTMLLFILATWAALLTVVVG